MPNQSSLPEHYEIPPDLVSLNLNREVLVRITPAGEKILSKRVVEDGFVFNGVQRDGNGFTRMQLHEVAYFFGSGMMDSSHPPIETEIFVIPPEWQPSMDESQRHIAAVIARYSSIPGINGVMKAPY